MQFNSLFRNVNRNTNDYSNPGFRHSVLNVLPLLLGIFILFLVSACSSENRETETAQHPGEMSEMDEQAVMEPYVVTVSTYDFSFSVPGEVPSGWITFKLSNKNSGNEHELSIGRIPDGVSYREYFQEYVGAWATVLKEFQDGEIDSPGIHTRVEELLPEWADQVTYLTSRGLVSPGRSAEKTVYLEPGEYTLDCWAKTSDGYIHVSSGMTRPLTVTEEPANSPEPSPDETITLHETEIEVNWNAETGHHSFAMNFDKDSDGRPVHNNIHLIKTDEDTDLSEVNNWLDWYRVGGLRTPGPADFLGGISTYYSNSDEEPTYFSLTIDEPGQYAWIVHTDKGEELWKEFTIE